jgi:hypothetical protein
MKRLDRELPSLHSSISLYILAVGTLFYCGSIKGTSEEFEEALGKIAEALEQLAEALGELAEEAPK